MPDDEHPSGLMNAFGIKGSAEVKTRTQRTDVPTERVQPNVVLIRERVKIIVDRISKEVSAQENIFDTQLQARLRTRISEMVDRDEAPLTAHEKSLMLQNSLDEFFGFGPLGPLLRDPNVADICVNGAHDVWAEQHGRLLKTSITFEDDQHLRQTIDKLISPIGLRLDEACPSVVFYLPNGTRATATIPPVSVGGATLTLECFRTDLATLPQHVKLHTLSAPMADLLKSYIDNRASIIVSGAFASGKSTFLNALMSAVDASERVITIEDKTELRPPQKHWIRLAGHPADENSSSPGASILKSMSIACRMRPDRIILGECAGVEAHCFLQSVAAAYPGSMMTVTARSPGDCVRRLVNMIALTEPGMPAKWAHELISDAVQVIVQMKRLRDGTHLVEEITELRSADDDTGIRMQTVFRLDMERADTNAPYTWRDMRAQ